MQLEFIQLKKKAEKMAKFEAKKAKQAQQQGASKSKDTKEPKKPKDEVPKYVDNKKPGEKKILTPLDDPALKAYVPANVEFSWFAWCRKQNFFAPQLQEDGSPKPQGQFVILAPPPNVMGALHIGHALTISLQDTLVRYSRMKGRTTLFIPGFDHAGILTQSVVEKNIWNKERKTRHDFGREKFVDLVWEWKEDYHKRITAQISALGVSYDWNCEAFTMDAKRTDAVNEEFVRLFDDGTLYRAERLVNWCVALRTTLSNLEVDNKAIPGRTMLNVPDYNEPVEFGVITSFGYPVDGSDEKIIVSRCGRTLASLNLHRHISTSNSSSNWLKRHLTRLHERDIGHLRFILPQSDTLRTSISGCSVTRGKSILTSNVM